MPIGTRPRLGIVLGTCPIRKVKQRFLQRLPDERAKLRRPHPSRASTVLRGGITRSLTKRRAPIPCSRFWPSVARGGFRKEP